MAIERELTAGDRLVHSTKTREGLPTTPKIIDAGGTAGTGCTVTHYYAGNQHNITTKITISDLAITTGDNASLGIGKLIYTFSDVYPLVIQSTSIAVGLTSNTDVTNDTPEIGLGTVIASGAVSVLGGTAAFEDLMAGAATPVLNDTNGTLEKFTHVVNTKYDIGSTKTVHLNLADAWQNCADPSLAKLNGDVWIHWNRFGLPV